jgi:hypothetical protein
MDDVGKTEVQAGGKFGRYAFAIGLTVIYLYSFPYFEGIRSANELPRIYLTMAMVDRGALNIDPELKRFQGSPDTSVYGGKHYCNKAPGMSFLALPTYIVMKAFNGWQPLESMAELRKAFYWFRLTVSAIPSLLFLLLLWRVLSEVVRSRPLRQLILLGYGVGTMSFIYGTLFIAHQLSALLVGAAFYLIWLKHRGRGGRFTFIAAGFLAGFGVLVDYQVAFAGPPLFIYLLWRMGGTRNKAALQFCLAAAVPLILLLLYHWGCFDNPLKTGYHYLANPTFKKWHSKGFLGLSGFKFGAFANRHFSPNDGLFYYSPFLLLAFPGLVVMMTIKKDLRGEGLLCLVVIAFFIYFASALAFVSGWDVGPRYVAAALPFYVMPIAIFFERFGKTALRLAVPLGLVVASIVIYGLCNAVFPHYPDGYSDPFFDVTVRYAFAGYIPYNMGWLLGLEGIASLMPYLALLAVLVVVPLWKMLSPRKARIQLVTGSLLVAALVLGSYYGLLAYRARPVPMKGMTWIHKIWEPRHSGMSPEKLRRQIGPTYRTGKK